jgi:hypothetical protein
VANLQIKGVIRNNYLDKNYEIKKLKMGQGNKGNVVTNDTAVTIVTTVTGD